MNYRNYCSGSNNCHLQTEELYSNCRYIDSKINNFQASISQLSSTDTNLASQITQLNSQITSLNSNINELQIVLRQNTDEIHTANNTILQTAQKIDVVKEELKTDISQLNNNLATNNTNLENTKNEVTRLSNKITHLMSFIPLFVKTTGSYFVRLLTHIKTDTINKLEELFFDDGYIALLEGTVDNKQI